MIDKIIEYGMTPSAENRQKVLTALPRTAEGKLDIAALRKAIESSPLALGLLLLVSKSLEER